MHTPSSLSTSNNPLPALHSFCPPLFLKQKQARSIYISQRTNDFGHSDCAIPIEFESNTEQGMLIRPKASAYNYGSDLSPEKMLKKEIENMILKQQGIFEKNNVTPIEVVDKGVHYSMGELERGFPHYSIFHDRRDEESLKRIRRDMISLKKYKHRIYRTEFWKNFDA